MKDRFFVLIAYLFICQSCVFIHVDDSIDLGNGYRYTQDSPEAIIWQDSKEYKGVGNTVVPPQVIDYRYNENYIIAKSVSSNGRNLKYWIIDKSKKPQNIESFDSISFFHQKQLLEISLGFQ